MNKVKYIVNVCFTFDDSKSLIAINVSSDHHQRQQQQQQQHRRAVDKTIQRCDDYLLFLVKMFAALSAERQQLVVDKTTSQTSPVAQFYCKVSIYLY